MSDPNWNELLNKLDALGSNEFVPSDEFGWDLDEERQ